MGDDPVKHRIEFKIGEAFPAEDRMARYVMRLSMALGDLRTAVAEYAVRPDQPMHERIYFVRLGSQHLRELVKLLKPPSDQSVIPTIDEFIDEVVPDPDAAARLRSMHTAVLDLLGERFEHRKVTLWQELRRLRNGFAHYHGDARSDAVLRDAMRQAADIDSGYVLRGRTMRAEYADEVINKLSHPFPDEQFEPLVRELHGRIVDLVKGPLTALLHFAEAVYLGSRPRGVVRRIDTV